MLAYAFDPSAASLVAQQIAALQLDPVQLEKLKSVLSGLLTDTLYTVLLGLDGAGSIGDAQIPYTLLDEDGDELSGEIEAEAYEYFHAYKAEAEQISADLTVSFRFESASGPRTPVLQNEEAVNLWFPLQSIETTGKISLIDREQIFPQEFGIDALIKLENSQPLAGMLRDRHRVEIRVAGVTVAKGEIVHLWNNVLRK